MSNTSNSSSVGNLRHLARLAGLTLKDAEAERLAGELEELLAHFQALGHGDADGDGDTRAARGWSGVDATPLRADDPGPDPLAAPPGDGAPGYDSGFFTVPRLRSHAAGEDAEERGDPEGSR